MGEPLLTYLMPVSQLCGWALLGANAVSGNRDHHFVY